MRILVYLSILLALVGCKDREKATNKDSIKEIKVNPGKDSKLLFSNIVECVREVSLRTPKDDPIGEISQLIVSESRYLILDKVAKAIWVFHRCGLLDYKIDKIGYGPGEFLDPFHICFDEVKNEIQVTDNIGDKVLFYNMKNGSFIRSRKFEYSFKNYVRLEGGDYAVHTNKKMNFVFTEGRNRPDTLAYNIYILDSTFQIKKNHFPYKIKNHSMGLAFSFGQHFSRYNDKYLFMESFNDTIYQIDSSKIIPKYLLDFGGNEESVDLYNIQREKIPELLNKLKGVYMPGNFVETKEWISFTYFFGQKLHNCIYYKDSESVFSGILIDDLTGCVGYYKTNSIDKMYYVVDYGLVNSHLDYVEKHITEFPGKYFEKVLNLKEKMEPNGNPIIHEVVLKKVAE
jgi:hypothetical protein